MATPGDDLLMNVLLAIGCLVVIAAVYIFGRLKDPLYRAKFMRKWLKTKSGCLKIRDLDKKVADTILVDFSKDSIFVKGKRWLINDYDITREDKPECGFRIKDEDIRYDEGVPVVEVDDESLTPIRYADKEKSNVKPMQLSSILSSLIANERARRATGQENINVILLALAGLCLLALLMNYVSMQKMDEQYIMINDTKNDVNYIRESLNLPEGQIINGKVVTK
jgi:hypothetical protein